MENLQTENLQALLRGEELNDYQRALAKNEYKELVLFAYETEKQVKKFELSGVGVPKGTLCKHKGCKHRHVNEFNGYCLKHYNQPVN